MSFKIFTTNTLRELPPANGEAPLFRDASERYWLNVVNKDHADTLVAEVHEAEADLYVALQGEGDLYLGGTLCHSTTPSAGQQRGDGLDGATRHPLRAGDVVIIPEGTPHMLDTREGQLTYLVVKIALPDLAKK